MNLVNRLIGRTPESIRIERKIVGHAGSRVSFRNFLCIKNFSVQFQSRIINSIYFDTDNLDFVTDNINGISERLKLRLRYYNEEKCFYLEYKLKKNLLGYKIIRRLNERTLSTALNKSQKIIFNDLIIDVKPKCLISYKRNYFINKNIRATIDSNISYKTFLSNSLINNFYKNRMPLDVLEFKYHPDQDNLFRSRYLNLVNNSNYLRNMKSSKYVHAMTFSNF
jgi:hypothetical protein